MRTHGTVGTLDLYKSFNCPICPHRHKRAKKCPIKVLYIKQIGHLGRLGHFFFI